jgi:hypothetical protein
LLLRASSDRNCKKRRSCDECIDYPHFRLRRKSKRCRHSAARVSERLPFATEHSHTLRLTRPSAQQRGKGSRRQQTRMSERDLTKSFVTA